MRAIIVDDEPLMLKRFNRLSEGIPNLDVRESLESGEEAIAYAEKHTVDIAFLDISMPIMSGVEVAKALRKIRSDMIIVFVTAYDDYLKEFNEIGGDYYIIKPYSREVLEMAMDKIRLFAQRQHKDIYIQTFGRFVVKKDGQPISLTGKAKEILALIVTKRGKEVSNEELFYTIWEGRVYSNESMTVYYNALRRLKKALESAGLGALLISTARGQMVNTELFDCDYYAFLDKDMLDRDRFDGEFLSEYSWGEYILADLINNNY
ncbi:response regulator [Ruminococcus sp.]|uniref:response regulator n=1 Tax=Ruminococcus sp. TaxID=41978 RepID=UPI003890412D